MKPIRCNNCRFFYDSDKYAACPYCQEAQPDTQVVDEGKVDVSAVDTVDVFSAENEKNKIILNKVKGDENNFTPHSSANYPHVVAVTVAKTAGSENFEKPFMPEEPAPEPQVISEVAEKTVIAGNCTVGWLVCLKGEYFGKSFVLKPGQNLMGRDCEMHVSLPEEKSVLNQNHATIFYDQSTNRFRLIPGDTRGLTYLNGDLKTSECELRPGDKLLIGSVAFIFVPLCGSKFRWDDYVK